MSRLRRSGGLWLADGLVLAVVVIWALGAQRLPEFVLPGPLAVARRLLALFSDPEFLYHTAASTCRVLLSVVAALIIGTGLALLQRVVPALDWVIRGGVQPFLNSFPSIGWAILAMLVSTLVAYKYFV